MTYKNLLLQLRNLKDVSNCLNEVMLEISGLPEEDPENEKLVRIVDRQLNGCTTLVKRQLKQCQVSVPTYFFWLFHYPNFYKMYLFIFE